MGIERRKGDASQRLPSLFNLYIMPMKTNNECKGKKLFFNFHRLCIKRLNVSHPF